MNRPHGAGSFGLALCAGALLGGLLALDGRRLQTSVLQIPLAGWTGTCRIVQLSDLHDTRFGRGDRNLVRAVAAANPDLIVLTGDILDRGTYETSELFELAHHLVALAPTYAVSGNHEGGTPWGEPLLAGLTRRGVRVLRDETVEVRTGRSALRLAGIDDPRLHGGPPSSTRSPRIDARLASRSLVRAGVSPRSADPRQDTRRRAPTILLAHRPELLDVYARHDVDLVLAGHAHGGQWRLPGIGGLYAPNQGLFPRLTAGMQEKGGTRLVISRGLKVRWSLPRLANRPEIVVLDLVGAASAPGRDRDLKA